MNESTPGGLLAIQPRKLLSGLGAVAASVVVALSAVAWQVPAWAQDVAAAAQSSTAAGVTVSVTPVRVSRFEWTFKVVLDTHTQSLNDDLSKTAVLLVDGVELHPALWSAAAGGHHREGMLSFGALSQRPASVELRIARPGEPEPRVFRWDGNLLP